MKTRFRQNGFSLAELLVSVAIGGVVSLGVSTILARSAQNQGELMELMEMESVRQTLLRNLGHPNAWKNTIAEPANKNANGMLCLTNNTQCAASTPALSDIGVPFRLMSGGPAPGTVVYDSTAAAPTNGFTSKGAPCAGFVPTAMIDPNTGLPYQNPPVYSGNSNCPFRFEMRWKPACLAGDCLNPPVVVNARLHYNPGVNAPRLHANFERYSIINYWVKTSPCQATTVIYQVGQDGNFPVPEYSVMFVELWGGGGGGAAPGMLLNDPGDAGGDTAFGALTATGGAGGPAGLAGGSFIFGCIMGNCWIPFPMGAGSIAGGNGPIPAPPQIPPAISQCGTSVTPPLSGFPNGISGIGGGNSLAGIVNAGGTGTAPGGGGSGSIAANGVLGNGWGFGPFYSLGGSGGNYVSQLLVNGAGGPAPGSSVPVTIGAGGAGGLGISLFMPFPGAYFTAGYPGGGGFIRITYQ